MKGVRKRMFLGLLGVTIAATIAALGAADPWPGPEAAQRLVGRDETVAYERGQFLVDGKLPAPAL